MAETNIRWRLAGEDAGQPSLFPLDDGPGRRELPGVEYLHVRARRVISAVPPAARLPFQFTLNAYRGCAHACTYCFARPTHEYLGMSGGTDFERRIVVKVNVVERLAAELADPRWGGDAIAMGTNTDPYQPCEGRYRLTRGVIGALLEADNPFSILTKSTMILRDIDLLAEAAGRGLFQARLSIGTLDEAVWRTSEPGTPPPARRLDAVRRLAAAGIPTGVMIAPILPGLSDAPRQLDDTVRACLDAGAASVTPVVLHLRPGVRELYMPWLADLHPDLVGPYERLYHRASGYAHEQQARVAARVQRIVDEYGPVRPAATSLLARRRPGPGAVDVAAARDAIAQLTLDVA